MQNPSAAVINKQTNKQTTFHKITSFFFQTHKNRLHSSLNFLCYHLLALPSRSHPSGCRLHRARSVLPAVVHYHCRPFSHGYPAPPSCDFPDLHERGKRPSFPSVFQHTQPYKKPNKLKLLARVCRCVRISDGSKLQNGFPRWLCVYVCNVHIQPLNTGEQGTATHHHKMMEHS